jgi:DNA-directed RNA polymerase beta subunit
MIRFKNLIPVTQSTDGIIYQTDPANPFLIIYFPENSNLIDDYPKLNIRKTDVRIVVTPLTKLPRTILTNDIIKMFKQQGLYNISNRMKVPRGKNFIFDMSQYLEKIDGIYKPTNYRQKSGILIKSALNSLLTSYPPDYQKILMYSVDMTKDLKSFVNRKSFLILQMLKDENFPFDHIVFVLIGENKAYHRLLMKDKKFQLNKIITILKRISTIDVEKEQEEETEKAIDNVVDSVIDQKLVKVENKEKIRTAVRAYLNKSPEKTIKVLSKEITDKEIIDITTTSILQHASGNISRAENIVDKIPTDKKRLALKAVDKNFTDEIIPREKTITTSENIAIKILDVPNMVDNKSPEHLFRKRAIDFQINLKKDMYSSFNILEHKEVPLKVESLNIVDKKIRAGEIDKSDESLLKVILKDEFGNKHDITIELPKIDPISGTFRINGQKKCLINQIILCPITFPKPYDSKFESSYSSFHIWSKKTKKMNYLEIYIASYKLPYLILLAYSFGFKEVLKEYGLTYEITKKKSESQYSTRISPSQYISFKNVDSDFKKEVVNSFIRSKIDSYRIDKEFGTSEYFNDLIIRITGKINSTYKIRTNLENIVDPVSRQVLMNQDLPIDLDKIMKYMSQKVVTGYTQVRNDLSNQRIRNSEVLVHLAQKQILAAYTNFKEQVLAGNKSAKFQIVPTKVISDFINSEIVVNMEYGNPLEEMATLSKVSPVGKSIGGIPGKEAVQMESRSVHDSYFGNIDPLDTPEGPSIGIIQQLTVDSYITSARGLIKVKPKNNEESSGILSTSTTLIPFIENNEGARIIMAANQARQVLPLKNPEYPIVQSGYESILTNVISDNFIKRSPCDGKVSNITKDHIEFMCKNGIKSEVDINPASLKSGSGKNTLSMFNVIVKKGQSVKKNDIVAEGSCIHEGSIALGRTIAVGILPYKGFNYEDGVVINERLIQEDKLTSLHLIEIDILISEKDRLLYINELGKFTIRGEPLLRKSIGEIEELIGFEEDDETDITAGQYIKKSPGGLIADIDVFSNVSPSKFPKLKELADRTAKRYKKPSDENFTIHGRKIDGVLIRFKIQQELNVNLGDKLCNRYGNKGIVSLIEKDNLMPRTPWGERLDFIINPLGILNRMNIGQLYEMYCGLISRKLADILKKNKNKRDFISIVKKVLPLLDNSKKQEYSTNFINNLQKLNDSQFSLLWEQINNKNMFPIIIPPFKAPNYKMIKNALNSLDLKTKYKLYLPEFNCYTNYEVPFGYMYIYKLEHMGDMKIHSRSTGPVTGKVLQPTAGKAREGGQRLGEQESLSFVSYGALLSLAEFFGPLSDDHVTKNEIISDIIQTGHAAYRFPKTNPAKDLLNAYFTSLMISG